jgi:hypothetical protein
MGVLSIAGVAPGIGKTAVAEMALAVLKGWHVARVRVGDEVPAPAAPDCAETGYVLLPGPAAAETDPDAARMLAAGGQGGHVLLAEPRGLTAGLKALRRLWPEEANVVVEGNAYLWAAEADLAVMVIGPGRSGKGLARVRPSVRELFPKVGMWAWNTRTRPANEGFFEFPQELARMGFGGAVHNRAEFHHVCPPQADDAGNAAFLEAVRDAVDGDWWRRGSQEFLRRIGFHDAGTE